MKRFNWLDRALLILLALGIALGFFAVRYMRSRTVVAEGLVTYRVLISDIPLALYGDEIPLIQIGDLVRSQNGTTGLGVVSEIEQRTHRTTVAVDGALMLLEKEGYVDYLVTVTAEATEQDGEGIRVGDIRIAAGSKMTVWIGDFLASSAGVAEVIWRGEEDAE